MNAKQPKSCFFNGGEMMKEKRTEMNFPLTRSDFEKWGELIEERERKQKKEEMQNG